MSALAVVATFALAVHLGASPASASMAPAGGFQYGYDFSDQVPYGSGSVSGASDAASDVMSSLPASMDDISISDWGLGDPEPTPGTYAFAGIENKVAMVLATGGTPVITLAGVPAWMTADPSAATPLSPPTIAHYADFATLSAKIADAFPRVKYFVVWREMQGFWDPISNSYDSSDYTQMYNDVYRAIKAVRPDAEVGGPYVSLTARDPGTKSSPVQGPWGTVAQSKLDAISYWLQNNVGADFLAVDGATPVAKTDDPDLEDPVTSAEQYAASDAWMRSQTNLPIWWMESHIEPDAGWTDQQAAAARIATLTEMAASGAAVGMQWQPQDQASWPDEGLWTSTLEAGGGQPTTLATELPSVLSILAGGVSIVGGEPPGVLVATGPQGTVEVNATSAAATATVNQAPATLDAGQVVEGSFTDTSTPAAPTMGSVTVAAKEATATFEPPSFDGGRPISSYTVTATDVTDPAAGALSESGSGSPITVGGLTSGDSYDVTVAATNSIGAGPASDVTAAAVPDSAPDSPQAGSATVGNSQALVSFSPPTADGGSRVTSYTVTATDTTEPADGGQTGVRGASPIKLTGLTNGDSYTFSVAATNAIGTGPASAPTGPEVPISKPAAPADVAVADSGDRATISFAAPSSDGGSPIDDYTVTATDGTDSANGGQVRTGSASPITVTGLTEGDQYWFRVAAVNAAGAGPSSGSGSVVAATVPGAPTIGTVTTGNGQAVVAFTAPAADGGRQITHYTVTATDTTDAANGGQVRSGTASPIDLTGLTNGDVYSFTVAATNPVGTGSSSRASGPATPATRPGSPGAATASGSQGQATISFQPVASDGGAPVTSYTVTASNSSNPDDGGQAVTGSSSPITVTGLTDGDRYRFTVTAGNSVGTGPASWTPTVLAASPPGAPRTGTTTSGNGKVTIAFDPPASDGGSSVTHYTVTATDTTTPANGGQVRSASAGPVSMTGLTNGDDYTFAVAASNAAGSGPEATTGPVAPAAVPSAPVTPAATAADGEATVSFAAPSSDGGAAVASYTVTAMDSTSPGNGGEVETGAQGPLTVTGLTNGDHYRFTVAATNSAGTGSAVWSNTVTPMTVAAAPTAVTATGADGKAQVSFAAPVDDGGATITSYLVTATDSSGMATVSQSGRQSPVTVGGLTNGDTYLFTVSAVNAAGDGPASAASAPTTPGAGQQAGTAFSLSGLLGSIGADQAASAVTTTTGDGPGIGEITEAIADLG